MELTVLRDFAVALLIGVLVGVDREQRKHDPDFGGAGGLRTFILVAEAGALSAWLAMRVQAPIFFVSGGVLVMLVLGAGYWRQSWAPVVRDVYPSDRVGPSRPIDEEEVRGGAVVGGSAAVPVPSGPGNLSRPVGEEKARVGTRGVTTLVAGLVVYLLGGTVIYGSSQLAVALAIATSAVLAYKESLHGLVWKIGRDDLYAALKLLAASFIILPVIPNETIDPWGALNPYKIWLLVVLISGLSLVGYVVSRVLGPEKGTPLTGLAGGLVSSTAVTLEFARRSRQEGDAEQAVEALAAGMLLAWTVMVVRVIAIVAVVHPPLVVATLPGLGGIGLATMSAAAYWWRRSTRSALGRATERLPLENPFNLISAMKFAALFAVVLLLVKMVEGRHSGGGMYVVAALAGLTDVDAITLSVVGFARGGGEVSMAVKAILIAALANTVCKAGVAAVLGTSGLGWRVGISASVIVGVGLVGLMW